MCAIQKTAMSPSLLRMNNSFAFACYSFTLADDAALYIQWVDEYDKRITWFGLPWCH